MGGFSSFFPFDAGVCICMAMRVNMLIHMFLLFISFQSDKV